jgi:hypothetical protein
VIPDATLTFVRTGTDDKFLVLLEHDRGTEERAVFMRKIQSYVAFVKAAGHGTYFAAEHVNICFTTFNGEARLNEMRAWTRSALHDEAPKIHRAFRFAALPQPLQPKTAWLEPRWHYPHDDQPQPLLAA